MTNNPIKRAWKFQPIAIIGVVQTFIGMMIALGVWELSIEQVGSIMMFVTAIGAALGWTQVSPTSKIAAYKNSPDI